MPSGVEIFIVLLAVAIFLAKASIQGSQIEDDKDAPLGNKNIQPTEAEIRREIERLKAERRPKILGKEVKKTPDPTPSTIQTRKHVVNQPSPARKAEATTIQKAIPAPKASPMVLPKPQPAFSANIVRKELKKLWVGKIILDPPVGLKNFKH